jgi:hypothetical protein
MFFAAAAKVGQIEFEVDHSENGARENLPKRPNRIKTALLTPDRRQQFNKTKQGGVGRAR